MENLKLKVLFLHFLMNFDQFFFALTITLREIILEAEMRFEPFWGDCIRVGVIFEALQ